MGKIPYEKEKLEKLCAESKAYNEVLVKSGRVKGGKNLLTLKKYIDLYNIDVSHFTSSTSPIKEENVVCSQCKEIKNIYQDFYWSGNKRVHSICKTCVCENEKKKYQQRLDDFESYKKTLFCKKCGEKRFYLLDFHHRNPEEKEFTISDRTRTSLDKLKKEIEKCDILCANCHREWHYLNFHTEITYDNWIK